MMVVLYKKPGCPGCIATVRHFNKNGIEFVEKDVTTDAEALARVQELGYQQMPVVETDTDHWSGYRKERIDAL